MQELHIIIILCDKLRGYIHLLLVAVGILI